MDQAHFVARFGGVFEHSAWVAQAVFEHAGGLLHDADALGDLFASVFLAADPTLQLETLRAHPQLACALAEQNDLTADSLSEQTGAGLDRCSAEEYAAFAQLNTQYSGKFGFPFIIAVRGLTRGAILDAFRKRLGNERPVEFQTALQETCHIARFRIGDMHNG
jgi:OHCU decarboxylase